MTARTRSTLAARQAAMRERRSGQAPTAAMSEPRGGAGVPAAMPRTFAERHYTANELAALWGVHPSTVRRIFEKQPGVLKLARPRSKRARSYVGLRIPESVAASWYREHLG